MKTERRQYVYFLKVDDKREKKDPFLRNLLLDEKNVLHDCSVHIYRMFEEADIESAKVDI